MALSSWPPAVHFAPARDRCDRVIRPRRRLRCSDAVPPQSDHNVLLVGAERADEFADALRLARKGHQVAVVNPRLTAAARAYRANGGRFLRASVEKLPRTLGKFDLICENYPYPYAQSYVSARAYALSRLQRSAPGGRWIVITEHPRFAAALRAVAAQDEAIRTKFTVRFSVLSPWRAPLSSYVRRNTRFRIVFTRIK